MGNEEYSPEYLEGIVLKESKIGQFADGQGVFANRDFKKGEIIIKYNRKNMSKTLKQAHIFPASFSFEVF